MYIDTHDLTQILVAVIGACGVIGAAIVALLVNIRRHAKTAAVEVKNNHTTNMREEQDVRYSESSDLAAETIRLVRSQGRRLGTIDRRIRRVETRLEIVEDTIPRPPRKRVT